MKRLLPMLLVMLCTQLNAQTLETTDKYPTGYLETSYFSPGNTIQSVDGVLYMVYDETPIVLLKYPPANTREEFTVPSTVRRIANNAFQGVKYLKTLRLYNEVTYGRYSHIFIGETAFNDSSIENFEVIDVGSSTTRVPTSPEEQVRREVARFDLQGRETVESAAGAQIIQYDDGTAKKVMQK